MRIVQIIALGGLFLLLQGCTSKTHELHSPCVAADMADNHGPTPCSKRRVNDNWLG